MKAIYFLEIICKLLVINDISRVTEQCSVTTMAFEILCSIFCGSFFPAINRWAIIPHFLQYWLLEIEC